MSIEKNVQIVKTFLRHSAAAISKVCWRCLPKILSGFIPGEDWPLAGTHRGHADWRIYFRRLTKRWTLRTPSPPSS